MAKRGQPSKKPQARDRLPNAPLVEVVFELRWALWGSPGIPAPFRSDPGVLPLLHAFTTAAEQLGFVTKLDMSRVEETGAYGVIRRYKKGEALNFPLLQIGVGIFAANEGPTYQWTQYKALVLSGVKAVLESYPNLPSFPLQPSYLELRYVDMFDDVLLNTAELTEFLSRGTTARMSAPPFLMDGELFEGPTDARVVLGRRVKEWKATNFLVDCATGLREGQRGIRLETKVVTQQPGVPILRASGQFLDETERWLDFAHGFTSPFFREFVTPDLMDQFRVSNRG